MLSAADLEDDFARTSFQGAWAASITPFAADEARTASRCKLLVMSPV